jgi:predicted nucleic acid-binding protein
MQKGTVVDMTVNLAIAASKLSLQHRLPMADSIILATAQAFDATIWTQDSDFKNISGVKFFSKK